ncbi:MAG: hypothetical protein HYY79_03660 [Betaproteobacteria bacterium]|nr:hypothetical protein [Betaproteobacteria bacterium]
MRITRFVISMFSAGWIVLGAGVVSGQDYPAKAIRILTQSVGGNPDFASRLIAQGIAGPLGQQVVVENRTSLIILGEAASKAPPDGHTLLLTAGSLWLAPLVQDNVPYNVVRDFSPITAVARSPSFLVVHPSLPVKSVKELIALAKARPGALNYASGVIGGALSFPPGATAAQYIRSGKLRALGTTGAGRSTVFPDLPTVAATVPGYEAVQLLGLWAPAKTPAAIVNRLNQEVVRALNSSATKEKLFNVGVEIIGSSPERFAAIISSEIAKWSKLIKDVGIHVK